MAIYPYRCPNCGQEWDRIRSPLDPVDEHCENCGAEAKRVWTSFKVYRSSSFTEGFDVGLGRTFDTDRQRQAYLDSRRGKYEKVYKRQRGIRVENSRA